MERWLKLSYTKNESKRVVNAMTLMLPSVPIFDLHVLIEWRRVCSDVGLG
jgi:hypothetical protein